MWKSILEWEKTYYLECNGADGIEDLGDYKLFLDHMRDRLLSWEGLGSQTIEEPSKYLQFKIDKAMTLIQNRSDSAIEQITKKRPTNHGIPDYHETLKGICSRNCLEGGEQI